MIGQELGSYRLVRELGAGGMGAVYVGEHKHMDRRAAIKVLLPELSVNAELVERFFAEARATSRIEHDGIVEVLDCGVHASGRAFIVMELLEGETLRQRVERGPLSLREVEAITRQVATAMAAAHARGIVHRDLKPDNVFLARPEPPAEDPRVKILDFGIAKLTSDDRGMAKTRTGAVMGTPLYMSPEQCRGAGKVDARTDVYALGCILFEMITGRPPFLSDAPGDLIVAHIAQPAPDLAAFVESPPEALRSLVAACLAKAPEDRPASMDEIAARFGGAARTLLIPPDLAAPLRRTTPRDPTPAAHPTTFSQAATERGAAPGRPRRLAVGLAAVGLAATAAVFGALASRRAPAPGPSAAPAAAPAAPAEIAVQVNGAPAGTKVRVDGTPRAFPIRLPAGGARHVLEFSAPGHAPERVEIDASGDRVIDLAMRPLGGPPVPAGGGGASPPEADGRRDRLADERPATPPPKAADQKPGHKVGKLDTPGGAKTKKRPDGKTDKADKTGGKTGAKIGAKKTDGFGGFDDI